MEICRKDSVVCVKLLDNVSFLTCPIIKEGIYDFILEEDMKLVIDLSQVNFMDSSGIGLIMSFLKHMKSKGGNLILEYPTLGVQKLFEMTRFDEIVEIKKTPEPKTGSWNEFD